VVMVASFTFLLHLAASIGVWFMHRSSFAFRTVLYTLVWPFHLHGVWLLIDPSWLHRALGPLAASLTMAGVFIVSSLVFRFISLLNLSKAAGPNRQGGFMLPFGGYAVGFAVVIVLVWTSSLMQETLPFLMDF
jgi:hypothetical protein